MKQSMLPFLSTLGSCFIPCDDNKIPVAGKNWQDKGYTIAEIQNLFVSDERIKSIGINTAKTNLICIDVDGEKALPFCQENNLPLPVTWKIGRDNDSARAKYIYRLDNDSQLPERPGKRSWPEHQLEVFWNSQQFIVTGLHPSGGHYTWTGTPDDIVDLPKEWIHFLQPTPHQTNTQEQQQQTVTVPVGDGHLIRLQDLLTREHSHQVNSGFLTGSRNNDLFSFAADAYSAETEALRCGAVLDSTADQLIQLALSHTDQSNFSDSEIQTALRSAQNNRTTTQGFEKRFLYSIKSHKSTSNELLPDKSSSDKSLSQPEIKPGRSVTLSKVLTTDQIKAIAELFPQAPSSDGRKMLIDAGDLSTQLVHILGDRLTYNELGYKIELDKKPLRDVDRIILLNALRNRWYKMTDQTLIEALTSAACENAYHPVRQYLQGLLNNLSIDQVDLYSLASDYLGAEGPLYATMLQRCLVGAVARAMNPGCQMDYICVLQGAQGIGKTSFWNILFGDWFKIFNSELGDKDSYLSLHDAWGIELGEIDGITSKKEAAKLKNFASTRIDYFRPPYGRTTQEFKRPSILVGSCNRDDFLTDTTGERRYWVIPVSKQLDQKKLYQWRDAIWRAAALTWKSGVLPYLLANLELENEKNNKRYSKGSILEPHLAEYLKDKQIASKSKVKEFVNSLNLVNPSWVDRDISAAMVRLSWRTHQYKGYPRVWVLDTPEAVNLGRTLVRTLDHSINTF